MSRYAFPRIERAKVPINLKQIVVEALPFADATFDSVVATLVFCSVTNPVQGLREIKRVLKPEGTLYMVEHVRSHRAIASRLQDMVTPLTRLVSGNCHWNRDTARTVTEAGFHVTSKRELSGTMMPMVVVQAKLK